MSSIEFDKSGVSIDASLIAKYMGLRPEGVLDAARAGRLTCVHEQGIAEDMGRTRLTFHHGNRRLRLTLDEQGRVIDHSSAISRKAARPHRKRTGWRDSSA
ncbi:MAG: DUF6522 family protein [Terriglobales bacterium]